MDANDFAHLEQLGYDGVLLEMTKGNLGQPGSPVRMEVEVWLKLKDFERNTNSSSKRDAREEETLSIARRALSIAEDANAIATRDLSAAVSQARWAKWAAIIAMLAAIIATKDQIFALIFGNL